MKFLEILARIPYQAWEIRQYWKLITCFGNPLKRANAEKLIAWSREAQDNEYWHLLVASEKMKQAGIKDSWFWYHFIPPVVAMKYTFFSRVLAFFNIRAIIFEDDYIFLDLLHEFLDMRGYEVLAFPKPAFCPIYKGTQTCCFNEEVCADFIISDLRMPGIGRIELVEKLHSNGCKVQNIALMSGGWSHEDKKRAEALMCKIFEKPFDIELLYAWLDECEKKINPNRKLLTILK